MIVKRWTSDSSWPERVYAGRHELPDGRVVVVTAQMFGCNVEFPCADRIAAGLPGWLVETDSLAELWSVLSRTVEAGEGYGKYVTCSIASYHPERRELDWLCSGSWQPILVPHDGAAPRSDAPRLPALGIIDDIDATKSVKPAPIRVQSGDTLFCCEGLDEIGNSDRVEYGDKRLREVATRAARTEPDAAAMINAVVRDCDEYCGHDWSDWPAALMVAVF